MRSASARLAIVVVLASIAALAWDGRPTPSPSPTRRAAQAPRARGARLPAPMPSRAPFVEAEQASVVRSEAMEARVDREGLHLRREGAFDVTLALASLGRGPAERPAARRSYVEDGLAIVDRGAVREWYVGTAEGIEQGFDLALAPEGTGEVEVALEVRGARARADGAQLRLESAEGRPLLAYRDLVVVDADGLRLPASMRASASGIVLSFDDRGARYPVRVDPFVTPMTGLLQAPNGTIAADQGCGAAVAIRGAIAAVGCPTADGPGGEMRAGMVLLYEPNGIAGAWVPTQTLYAGTPIQDGGFGRSLALDGARLLVGAPSEKVANVGEVGAVYVFTHLATIWSPWDRIVAPDPRMGLRFGESVALAGTRILVGAPGGSVLGAATPPGAAYVFSVGAMPTVFEDEFGGPTATGLDAFGSALAFDGAHAIVGAPMLDSGGLTDSGAAYLYDVSTAGVVTYQAELVDEAPVTNGRFGFDVDGEEPIAVVGKPRANGSNGAVMIFSRPASGARLQTIAAPAGSASDFFGTSVSIDAGALLVGSPGVLQVASTGRVGAAFLFLKAPSGFVLASKLLPPDAVTGDAVGFDVDLDYGAREAVVGAPRDTVDTSSTSGSARVFGIPDSLLLTVSVVGGGAVGSTTPDTGIDCGSQCVAPYAQGAVVHLVATPGAGQSLLSVSGGGCSASPCDVTMDAAQTVTFTFGTTTKPIGAPCASAGECAGGQCVDGVCCNAECGGGALDDCRACSVAHGGMQDGTCSALRGDAAPSVVCRAPLGGCDAPETCVGGSTVCPPDQLYPADFVCQPSRGVCDPAESCDGSQAACPPDLHENVGVPCGNGVLCDGAERCDFDGFCASPGPVACDDDGNPCTVDLCVDPVGCVNVRQPGCTVVDGGAVFADAGSTVPDGGDEDAAVTPAPPTFEGGGGCSCALGRASKPPLSGLFGLVVALGLARFRRRRSG